MLRVRPQTYIDTSVWCAFCFNEIEAPGARDWLAQASLDHAATAVWTRTEFASAAALKLRVKGQSTAAVNQAVKTFEDAVAMTHSLDVIYDDFLYAAELCNTSETGLRAGDALHIAVALRRDCKFLASLDKVMNASAKQLGLKLVKFD
jgi:predicted nucleic acid-binding protein